MAATDPLERLIAELDHRAKTTLPARLWLRDDDVQAPTPALDSFLALLGRHRLPAVFAAIPAGLSRDLSRMSTAPGVAFCVHGWSHANHEPDGRRKCEFGPDRAPADIAEDLHRGRAHIIDALEDRYIDLFVPPWNRIAAPWLDHVAAAGYAAISTLGHQFVETAPAGLGVLNVHVDVIDWRNARAGRPIHAVADDLAAALGESRADANQPIGLLTHHLVHDATVDATLTNLFAALAHHPAVTWLTPDEVLGSVHAGDPATPQQ